MPNYPRKRNGTEYYPQTLCSFLQNEDGQEVYARDSKGNEVYPPRDHTLFAKSASGEYYYAKDVHGNEFYPLRDNKSLYFTDPLTGRIQLAQMADGTQRYPTDGKGNEYYLRGEGRQPFLLRQNTGNVYLARSRNGHKLIPWNHLQKFVGEDPCVFSRDAEGNTVYIQESTFPPAFRALIRCICHISVICPKVTGCHTHLF